MKSTLASLTLALCLVSPAAAQRIERINPQGMTQPTAYSHVVKVGDMLFIAGQVAFDEQGQLVGGDDMRAQLRQVLENMKRVLASQGADFTNVVKINIFTTDIEAYRAASDVRAAYFTEAPASTLVQIERLASPELLVEIEAIAVVTGETPTRR